jgi:hypothetical protein
MESLPIGGHSQQICSGTVSSSVAGHLISTLKLCLPIIVGFIAWPNASGSYAVGKHGMEAVFHRSP